MAARVTVEPHESDDGGLDELIHRGDLDGLVRLIDARTASGDWGGLARVRERARYAVGTGRQLWPAATLAEYRLALSAPAEWAVTVLDEGSGRFTIGPLTEVVAQRHTWAELGPRLESGPRAGLVGHERVLRGDVGVAPDGTNPLDLPYELAGWEPAYCLATYTDAGVEVPSPDAPTVWVESSAATGEQLDDPDVELAVRQLVETWTASSDGHAEVATVAGGAGASLAALGIGDARLAELPPDEAIRWLAWAGASGGAHGRRRGAAAGRFGALWVVAALGDVGARWPVPLAELGSIASALRWWWFDAHEPATGWQLQLVVEDPTDGVAWAIAARDAA